MKELKASNRDKKLRQRKYGMRTSGSSVRLLAHLSVEVKK